MVKTILTKAWLWLISVLALFIAFKSYEYLDFKIKKVLIGREELMGSVIYPLMFYTHVVLASVALLIGPLQFFNGIRKRYRKWHITLGKVYAACCVIGSVTGFYLSFYTFGGVIATLGFVALSSLWFYSIFKGYKAIIALRLQEHQIWMFRNYALTFAAVTLRLWIALLTEAFDIAFDEAYQIAAWTCWSINIILVEIYLRSSRSYKGVFNTNNINQNISL